MALALPCGSREPCSITVECTAGSKAAPSLLVEVIEMRKSPFYKMLLASFAFVALACAPEPAFAQHGGGHGGGGSGGSHGGGGGGFHGGGGEAATFRVAGISAEADRLADPPWAAAQPHAPAAGRAALRGVHRARPRSIAAPPSEVAVRSQGPLRARVPAQALRRATLDQAHRARIAPPPMASGTPLQVREAQWARVAPHAPPATLRRAISPGRMEVPQVQAAQALRRDPRA